LSDRQGEPTAIPISERFPSWVYRSHDIAA